MTTTREKVNEAVDAINNSVPQYQAVDQAAVDVQTTFTNVKQTQVGEQANQIVAGVKSVTSNTDVAGAVNFAPTEGQLTKQALPGAVNSALNTDISSLSSEIGTRVSISYTDSGSVDSINTTQSASGSLSSILSKITGLGQQPGFLQNIISSSNAKGLTTTLLGTQGKVGPFANVAAVNNVSGRTLSIVDAVVASATTDGKAGSTNALNNLSTETSNAIADVSNMITGGTTISASKVVAAVTGVRDPNLLSQVRGYKNTRAGVVNQTNQFISDLSRFLPLNNKLGFMQNLVQKIDPGSFRTVLARNNVDLTSQELAEVAYLAQGTPNEREQAIQSVQEKTGKSRAEVETFFLDLDTTIAGTIVVDTQNSVFKDPFTVGLDDGQWNNGVGAEDFTFSFISSVEELEAEMRNISREVTEMVVHWTETYTNTNIGSEEINSNHIKLGLNGIGYHYIIRRDGSVQRGRPSGVEGEHTDTNNHNKRSIAVAFVGGLNCPSDTPNPLEYKSAASLTRNQYTSFFHICRSFFLAYPGGQILGHNDINPLEDDPGFDVRDYCEDMFGKKSLFSDPSTQPPFTAKEINSTDVPR